MTSRWRGIAVLASVLLVGGIALMSYGVAKGQDDPDGGQGWHGHWGHHDGWGRGMGEGHGFDGMMMFRRLDLTVAQQHQMVDVFAKHKADLTQKREQYRKARHTLVQAMLQDSPDRQAIGADFDQAASARKQLMLARLDLRQDLMAVLTADQKAKLKEFRAKGMEHMGDDPEEDD